MTAQGRAAGLPLVAAVDAGTTGARAIAYDLTGRLVAEIRRPYPTRSPRPGWAEQDAQDWARCAFSALQELAARVRRSGQITAIGLTGQCPTMVVTDRSGRPLRAGMMYRDNRAVAQAQRLREQFGDQFLHDRTGHVPEAFHVGPKLVWLREHEPAIFARTRLVLQPRDVVLHRLTGVLATDETHANSTLFFGLRERAWDSGLLSASGLDQSLFPAVLAPWQQAAELPASSAAELGLAAGLPVVIGAADSQCAAFGAGVTAPGPVSEMAGASSCLNSVVLSPLADLRVTHYSHVVPGCFSTELGVNTTGAAIAWAVRVLGFGSFASLAEAAGLARRRLQRRRAGLSPAESAPLFLPYLADGDRDDPDVRGAFIGLSERHDRAALAFAVLEGIALSVRSVLAVLAAAGEPLSQLRVGGGGARITETGQIKADLLGLPVAHLAIDPAGFGAAMLAADAAGLAEEARAAIAAALNRATHFTPSRWGSDFEGDRAAWFEQVRASAAVHSPPEER